MFILILNYNSEFLLYFLDFGFLIINLYFEI